MIILYKRTSPQSLTFLKILDFKYLENPGLILQKVFYQNSFLTINRWYLHIFFLLLNLIFSFLFNFLKPLNPACLNKSLNKCKLFYFDPGSNKKYPIYVWNCLLLSLQGRSIVLSSRVLFRIQFKLFWKLVYIVFEQFENSSLVGNSRKHIAIGFHWSFKGVPYECVPKMWKNP